MATEDMIEDATSNMESEIEEQMKAVIDDVGSAKNKQNKNERKARKALSKLGLKHVEEIKKVCIKKGKDVFFVIRNPDVYKLPNSDTYVVFGEAKVEDLSAESQSEAAQRLSQLTAALSSKDNAPTSAPMPEDQPLDSRPPVPAMTESQLNPGDIDLVMKQVGCSREVAVQALVANKGDIVESIMQLSS
ncbi:bifunctional Nascent polypeptide-associated complex NAC domain/Nascent polypeptide-associated complex subunit alpha-like [Babesia duncani]|uniref:Bifunctional Nascent polypeptide-associated complex NAC domain/Nascent polypeptide-associated complex subunit alpha-like n=1 Tax=Babesia duncani TaxID=323732 RepID=A0AAD9PK53_9APIC|nr:bifunctional Nascent polypeptide-associated complex NAC domain/Nascent polypeptide-associated complex subunit alpha-like [Babesia duncani]